MLVSLITQHATTLFVWSMALHLFVDWILQNDAIARNKSNLFHILSWVHCWLHFIGLALIFPVFPAFLIALSHLLIDTRVPLRWWRKFYRQTTEGDIALHVSIWTDQVLHISVLAIAALIIGR